MNELVLTGELKGIEESKARQIEAVFSPMVEMLKGFEEAYSEVVSREIDEQTCKDAKRLRLDIAKIRTSADKVRKEQKDEYLRAGNAIQGVYNILKFAVVDKEEKLKEIETFYERQEAERIEALRVAREEKLTPYTDVIPGSLGEMEESVFANFLAGTIANYNARMAAERAAEEQRRKEEEEAKTRAEQERKDREEKIAKEAKEEAERKAAEREARLKKEIEEAEAKAERDRIAAVERAKEAARLADEKEERLKREKEEARIKAEKDKIEAEKRAVEAERQRAERERLAKEAEEKRKRENAEHRERIFTEAVKSAIAAGIKETAAEALVKMIEEGKINHVSLNF